MIQTTASESTFVCLLAGRTEAIKRYQVTYHVYNANIDHMMLC